MVFGNDYVKNVEYLAGSKGFMVPLREDDRLVEGVHFHMGGRHPDLKMSHDELDSGEWFFLQQIGLNAGIRSVQLHAGDVRNDERWQAYFAERWTSDTSKFTWALQECVLVEIWWEERSS